MMVVFQNHPNRANDSAGSVGSGGIQFHKTEGIVMEKEDLFITSERIHVSYVFKNVTNKDITVDLFFPLPIQTEISGQTTWDEEILNEMKQHERGHIPFENFSVVVDGQKVLFKTEIRALQQGKDVTNLFHENNFSLSPVLAKCDYPMDAKENEACEVRMKKYKKLGLLSPTGTVLWQKQVHYHWSQTFPKGKEVKIEHSYRPARGSFFLVPDPTRSFVEVLLEQSLTRGKLLAQFCPWQSTDIKGNFVPWLIHEFQKTPKPIKPGDACVVMFYDIDYILTTGANWKGPIRDFTLTIEYPKEGTIASCWPFFHEMKAVGNNQLQFHQKDFKPEQDVKILFGEPCHL